MRLYKYEIEFVSCLLRVKNLTIVHLDDYGIGGEMPSWVISTAEGLVAILEQCWELNAQGADLPVILTSKPFDMLVSARKRNVNEKTLIRIVCKGLSDKILTTDYGVN